MNNTNKDPHEKELLKLTRQYNEDKLIKISGKGEKGEDIYNDYLFAIKNEYNMTIEEACHFIGCSYTYFTTRLISKIYHIRINTTARKLIYLYSRIREELDENLKHLINKRVLLSRIDFFQYMKLSTLVTQQYKVMSFDDFDSSILDEIQKNLDIYNEKLGIKYFNKTPLNLFNDVILLMSSENEPENYPLPEDFEMPEKFYSLKEIKSKWFINHDIEVYRMLDANGARKFMLCDGDFVRYDIRELERKENSLSPRPKNIVRVDYKSYLLLSQRYVEAEKEIQMQALKASKKLAEGSGKKLR